MQSQDDSSSRPVNIAFPVQPGHRSPSLEVPPLQGQAEIPSQVRLLDGAAAPIAGSASPSPSQSLQDMPMAVQLQVGSETLAGRRVNSPDWVNQDAHLVADIGHNRTFVGVFDGHGQYGHHIAAAVRDLFAQVAPLLPASSDTSLPLAFSRLFAVAEEATQRTGLADLSGTTAAAAIVDATSGLVSAAHVGDSRLLLAIGPPTQVAFQTIDHIIDKSAEERILEQGGEVRQMTIAGVVGARVFLPGSDMPGLNMARAIGDTQARSVGVTSEPTVTAPLSLPPGSALVVASDGVWEKLSSETVASIALSMDAEAAAKELVRASENCWLLDGGDIDDITAVVVRALAVQPSQA
jgi:serine/threonine protein phosphatase PrpC